MVGPNLVGRHLCVSARVAQHARVALLLLGRLRVPVLRVAAESWPRNKCKKLGEEESRMGNERKAARGAGELKRHSIIEVGGTGAPRETVQRLSGKELRAQPVAQIQANQAQQVTAPAPPSVSSASSSSLPASSLPSSLRRAQLGRRQGGREWGRTPRAPNEAQIGRRQIRIKAGRMFASALEQWRAHFAPTCRPRAQWTSQIGGPKPS